MKHEYRVIKDHTNNGKFPNKKKIIELCDADYRTGSSIAKIAHLRAPNNI